MNRKQKLELTWIGKENRPKLEPRILLEDPATSYHARHRMADKDIFDNRLIFGDNLLALRALEAEFSGKIKCIYIDPPYNTGSAFEHYDDGIEHSLWLSLIRERLELLWRLLRPDGSLWISIDDREMPYLRVLLDETCGRSSFIASNVWQKRYSRENREAIGDVHEYVIVYAKDVEVFKRTRNRVALDEKSQKIYKNPNNDPRGRWRGIPMTAQGYRPNQMYTIRAPGGAVHSPPEGRCWSTTEENFKELLAKGRIYFGKGNNSQPNVIRYLSEVGGFVPWTWWPHDEVGHTDEAKKEQQRLFDKDKTFDTAKPERLIKRVVEISTNPGDIVLDSFAGSGTTGAVAHKMGRRWIMVELGQHCHTHIIPRLKKVIDGEYQGGITKSVNWKGGGGFRYYRLAPSLLEKDKWGNWVINKTYNAAMLTEALCKLEGFTCAPSDSIYWQHGYSTEQDFIYVTTANLNHEQLQQLSDEVGPDRSLLVLCTAFRSRADRYSNLTVKKIPKAVLARCEWGHDDYSLRVENLPQAPPSKGQIGLFDEEPD
ncbi:MAG: site-specific DNA-methyltransferase [bacterium]